jgi:acetyl-CoA carboxylase, biotin carboxylase subunit
VAVYSEADRESLHVRFADEDVCIGPASGDRELPQHPRIIAAAEITGAEAIHPGYGFLAENAEFSRSASARTITFIGPTPDRSARWGTRPRHGATMIESRRADGSGLRRGRRPTSSEAKRLAPKIGFPIMIKASAGGGGQGDAHRPRRRDLPPLFEGGAVEARAAFGDSGVYLEKCILKPRHVEFQVFGDQHGRVVHLGERDCSIQRRHQKLVEEAPSPRSPRAPRADGRATP